MAVEDQPHPEVDWEAVERWPEFQELVHRRRAFVIPATVFFLAWYMAFILLCGYAPDFMAESVYQGLTVGYVWALTQFVMVAVLGLWYLGKADREFDPLAEAVIDRARQSELLPADRFARKPPAGAAKTPEVQA
jgi:uncharacterized membrane protein (DUF485 family)